SYAQVAGAVGIYPIRQVARDFQRYAGFGYVTRRKSRRQVSLRNYETWQGKARVFKQQTTQKNKKPKKPKSHRNKEDGRLLNF
ncbi:MAG: hypothetical protein ACRD40_04050, partial [Candidatus Acidiferrales bacterium]